MPAELSLDGVYISGALLLLVLILPVFAVADRLLLRQGLYHWFWHPALCRMALFIFLYSASYAALLG